MHVIGVNDSEGEPVVTFLGDRIGQDFVGERQEGGEHYPNNYHHFSPFVVHFSPIMHFCPISRWFIWLFQR